MYVCICMNMYACMHVIKKKENRENREQEGMEGIVEATLSPPIATLCTTPLSPTSS